MNETETSAAPTAPEPMAATPEKKPRTKPATRKTGLAKKLKPKGKKETVKKVPAAAPAPAKRGAGVKAQGQIHKEAMKLVQQLAKKDGVTAAEIVRRAVHKFVGFKDAA